MSASFASTSASSPPIQLDLGLINAKLTKLGLNTIKAIHAPGNCVICYGRNQVTEWCLLVPCGHVTCTDCMRQIRNNNQRPQFRTYDKLSCPLCRGASFAVRLDQRKHATATNLTLQMLSARQPHPPASGRSWTQSLYDTVGSIAHSLPHPWRGRTPQATVTLPPNRDYVDFKPSIFPIPLSLDLQPGPQSTFIHFTYELEHHGSEAKGIIRIAHDTPACTTPAGVPLTYGDVVPIDLVILLDVSGSVSQYFDMFCRMIHECIDRLGDHDRFALITFSDATTQPFALQPTTSENRVMMKNHVHRTPEWGAGTNLQAGIQHSIRVLQDGHIDRRAMHFMLITDGQANRGHEGLQEMKQLIGINGLIVKMCTFGQNIDAHILTDALGTKISDYVHLIGTDDFARVSTQIIKERAYVVADNIQLHIRNEQTDGNVSITPQSLPQLLSHQQLLHPFTFTLANHKKIEISITYKDDNNQSITQFSIQDHQLQRLIEPIHMKTAIGQQLMNLLAKIQALRQNIRLLENNSQDYMLRIAQYKKELITIETSLATANVGEFKDEIQHLLTSIKDTVRRAEADPEQFTQNANYTNSSMSCGLSFMTGKSSTC